MDNDNGQWTMDNGQWTMDNGQWTMDNGQCEISALQALDLENTTYSLYPMLIGVTS